MEINRIYCMDCLEFLKEIPEKSVDLVLVDPPYNISQEGQQITRSNMKFGAYRRDTSIKLDFGDWDKMEDKEFFDFTEAWFSECCRVLKDGCWVYVFFDKQKTGFFDLLLAKKYGIRAKSILVWEKTNPAPQFRKANFISATEFIWAGVKGNGKIKNFGRQIEMGNVFHYPNSSSYAETSHPTEKPLELIKYLIKVNSYESDVVLDCFMGSGTTALACKQLNRNFIGCDKSEEYCKMAEKRLAVWNGQKRLSEIKDIK